MLQPANHILGAGIVDRLHNLRRRHLFCSGYLTLNLHSFFIFIILEKTDHHLIPLDTRILQFGTVPV